MELAVRRRESLSSIDFGFLERLKQNLKIWFAALFGAAAEEKWKTRSKETQQEARHSEQTEQIHQNAARLLDTFGDAVLRMAYSYLHNMSDAEDILQETLIRYLKAQPDLSGPEHEKAWLLRVAANLSKNRLEYNRLRDTDELEETLIGEEREDLSFVWEAVKQLPASNREVIHLFYYEGYPTAQIAKVLNRRESTVRSDLRRGRERLKKILKEAYDFE